MGDDTGGRSPFHVAVELIGQRWNGVILRELLDGPRRFGELGAAVPRVSDRMLATRLRALDDAGLVRRRVTDAMPVLVTYELTSMGRDLEAALGAIAEWAERWTPAAGQRSAEG